MIKSPSAMPAFKPVRLKIHDDGSARKKPREVSRNDLFQQCKGEGDAPITTHCTGCRRRNQARYRGRNLYSRVTRSLGKNKLDNQIQASI